MPKADQLSVFRIYDLGSRQVWGLALQHLGPDRTVRGRADVTVEAVRTCKLDVEADDSPPRHANIVGWPEAKHAKKHLALKLAAASRFVPQPKPA